MGEWDEGLAQQALYANGFPSPNVRPVLMFLDYVFPEFAGKPLVLSDDVERYLTTLERGLGTPFAAVGTGPDTMTSMEDL